MELLTEFLNTYGLTIMYAVLTAVAGFVGMQIKNIYDQRVTDQRVRDAIETTVKAVEQIYHDLDGQTKYDECVKAARDLLATKGLIVSDIELKMLVESTVASFNLGLDGKWGSALIAKQEELLCEADTYQETEEIV